MTMPASKMSQAPSQATITQVLPTPTLAQVIDGPVTRSPLADPRGGAGVAAAPVLDSKIF